MGNICRTASHNQPPLYETCDNDIELVMRSTKLLHHIIDQHYQQDENAPLGVRVGLMEKIIYTQRCEDLSKEFLSNVRELISLRDNLVSDPNCNTIPDRQKFIESYNSVEKEIRKEIRVNDCVVM